MTNSKITTEGAHLGGTTAILKGWESFSPGLRGTSSAGVKHRTPATLQGLHQPPMAAVPQWDRSESPVRETPLRSPFRSFSIIGRTLIFLPLFALCASAQVTNYREIKYPRV